MFNIATELGMKVTKMIIGKSEKSIKNSYCLIWRSSV